MCSKGLDDDGLELRCLPVLQPSSAWNSRGHITREGDKWVRIDWNFGDHSSQYCVPIMNAPDQ